MSMQGQPTADPNQWRVISQEMTTGQDPSGKAARGRRVTYQLFSGQTGSVFVPDGSFNPDTVRAAIAADAQNVAAVANLTSGG